MRLRVLLHRLVGALLLMVSGQACGLLVSFDSYDTVQTPTLYGVGGRVDGLGTGELGVLLNGTEQTVRGDGRFAFPKFLADGAPFLVGISETAGRSCSIEGGSGTIAGADVTTVAIHCRSKDATLERLALSAGPLATPFDPAQATYAVSTSALAPPLTTTVTATLREAKAHLEIAGAAAVSGAASAPIPIGPGATPIDITVTAADGETRRHYRVVVDTGVTYLKASNTQASASFGLAMALDRDTLAVGAVGESSSARGIDGNQADRSAPFAGAVYVFTRTAGVWAQQAYLKPSNTGRNAYFGFSVALLGDTLAIGAWGEKSSAVGVNGDQTGVSAPNSGAVYVFMRTGTVWSQQAYLKASNTRAGAVFGRSVALAGSMLAVGSPFESSGLRTTQGDTSSPDAGAVYVFTRTGATWAEQAYLKASSVHGAAEFGTSVALVADTLAVGAKGEASRATGVGGDELDVSAAGAGAAYVFTRTGAIWSPQAYLKASNTQAGASFGSSLALSGDTLAVASHAESSRATGVNGTDAPGAATNAGAVYVFTRAGAAWSQQAYVKASNTRENAVFGASVALAGDVLAVGSSGESSGATGVNGNSADESAFGAGAAYVFRRAGGRWSQQAYVKAPNARLDSRFGTSIACSEDTLAIGAMQEPSPATGVNGDRGPGTGATNGAGAAYVFR